MHILNFIQHTNLTHGAYPKMGSFIPLDEDEQVMLYTRQLKQETTYYARFTVTKRELANNQQYLRESMKLGILKLQKFELTEDFLKSTPCKIMKW